MSGPGGWGRAGPRRGPAGPDGAAQEGPVGAGAGGPAPEDAQQAQGGPHRDFDWRNPEEDCRRPIAAGKPIVVLCGWLGCKERYLRRYREVYQQLGFHCITFRMHTRGAFSLDETAQVQIDALVKTPIDAKQAFQGDDWRLLFHSFSNTGWFCYGAILEGILQRGQEIFSSIARVVVDSAPHPTVNPRNWARRLLGAVMPHRDVDKENALQRVSIMLEKFFALYAAGKPGKHLQELAAVLRQEQKFPQLYIYSHKDKVIPSSSVESFMQQQKKLGRMCRALCFEDSPHVDHFRHHQKMYTQQLMRFLDACMPRTRKTNFQPALAR